jgi:hypothetical protein
MFCKRLNGKCRFVFVITAALFLASSIIAGGNEEQNLGTISSEDGRSATITEMEKRDGSLYYIAKGQGVLDTSVSTSKHKAELEKGKPFVLPGIKLKDGFSYEITEKLEDGCVAWKGTMAYVTFATQDTLTLYDQPGVTVSIAGSFDGEIKIAEHIMKAGDVWKIGSGVPRQTQISDKAAVLPGGVSANGNQEKILETGKAELVYAIGPDNLVYITKVDNDSGYREALIRPDGKYAFTDLKSDIGKVGSTFVLAADFYTDYNDVVKIGKPIVIKKPQELSKIKVFVVTDPTEKNITGERRFITTDQFAALPCNKIGFHYGISSENELLLVSDKDDTCIVTHPPRDIARDIESAANSIAASNPQAVACEMKKERFVVTDTTINDTKTGLVWPKKGFSVEDILFGVFPETKAGESQTLNITIIKKFLKEIKISGIEGWRLPGEKDMDSLKELIDAHNPGRLVMYLTAEADDTQIGIIVLLAHEYIQELANDPKNQYILFPVSGGNTQDEILVSKDTKISIEAHPPTNVNDEIKPAASPDTLSQEELVSRGRDKAKQLGLNPIPVYTNEDGNIIIVQGTDFTINNNKWALAEGDMVINVGSDVVKAENVELNRGEYAKVEGGKVVKFRENLAGIKPNTKSSVATKNQETAPEKSDDSTSSIIPQYKEELFGRNEVRIKNPNEFSVLACVRSAEKGKNLNVPVEATASMYVPNGKYEIFFVYSNKPDALFKGDDFSLNNNGVEIQIVKIVDGNYSIKRVK